MKTKQKTISQEQAKKTNRVARTVLLGLFSYLLTLILIFFAAALVNHNLYGTLFPGLWSRYQDKTTLLYDPETAHLKSYYGEFIDLDGDAKEDFLAFGCLYLTTATPETLHQGEPCEFDQGVYRPGDEALVTDIKTRLGGLPGRTFDFYDSQTYDIWTAGERPLLLEVNFLAVRAFAFEKGQVVEVKPTFEMWWLPIASGHSWPEWFGMLVALHVLPFYLLADILQR